MCPMSKFAKIVLVAALVPLAPLAWAADSSKGVQKVPQETRSVPPVPPPRNVPIDEALQAEAREVIKSSLASPDRIIRAHAIEATRQLAGAKARDEIVRGPRDPSEVVRFTAAMAVG